MGFVRIVIQTFEGKPFAGLGVALHHREPAEPGIPPVAQGTTDEEGVVRLWTEPGIYKVEFKKLPKGINPPKFGTTVRLEEITEGIEQIIRLVKVEK